MTKQDGKEECQQIVNQQQEQPEIVDYFNIKPKQTLQQAFEMFRKKKIAENIRARQNSFSKHRSQEQKDQLRKQFIEIAKSYIGTPYSRAEHPVGSKLRNYPIELDCCGLVRQVCYDMEKDLGFRPLFYNQSYQFDTLPKRFDTVDKILPGDLIFYQGSYFDNKKKPQKHNMVHVEIYYGDKDHPERCIGSRYRRECVSIFDSYKFNSTAWKLEKIWYCSIDDWLDGVCTSDCPLHPWESGNKQIVRGSIFEPIDDDEDRNNQGEE